MKIASPFQQYSWGLWSDQTSSTTPVMQANFFVNNIKIKMLKREVSYLILHTGKLLPWAYLPDMIHQQNHPITHETSTKQMSSGQL